MYSKLLWRGVSLILNRLKPDHISKAKSICVDLCSSEAKNTKYKYIIRINRRTYKIEFEFTTNVCIYGTLYITDMNTGRVTRLRVEKELDVTKAIESSQLQYEFYNCVDNNYMELTIADDKITDISTLEVVLAGVNNGQQCYKLNYITIAAPAECVLNCVFVKTMFAATATIDYNTTLCLDPVYIGNKHVNIIIFKIDNRRIVCLTKPRGFLKPGNIIHLVNSDFKQIIHTSNKDDVSNIEEYVLGTTLKPALRRNYTCKCNKELTEIIDSNNNTYTIYQDDKGVTFSKT